MRARVLLPFVVAAFAAIVWSASSPGAVPIRQPGQGTSTLDDQVELAVTVYNSDIALVRDVRNLQLPRGTFDLQLHGHRRDGESRRPCTSDRSPSRRASACSSRTTSTTCSSPTSCCASTSAATSRWCGRAHGGRHDARGGSEGAAPQLQQRAGLADRQRDRHRPARRSHPVSRAARQPLHAADADLDARQQRRRAASRRSVVSGRQAVVERRLRADRRRATTRPPISTAGSR